MGVRGVRVGDIKVINIRGKRQDARNVGGYEPNRRDDLVALCAFGLSL